jgi:hypothetical protein
MHIVETCRAETVILGCGRHAVYQAIHDIRRCSGKAGSELAVAKGKQLLGPTRILVEDAAAVDLRGWLMSKV